MTKEILIGSSIDDSTKLQKKIDDVGNTPAIFKFKDESHISVNTRLRFWNYFELNGANSTFEFEENVSIEEFGLQKPMISSKLLHGQGGAAGWHIHHIKFRGNRNNQKNVPETSPEHPNTKGNWGRGYLNYIGPTCDGDITVPNPNNAYDICIHDCDARDNLGDFFRGEGVRNLRIYSCYGEMGGHDFICAAAAEDVKIWDLEVKTAVNAAVRFRSVIDGEIFNSVFEGTKYNTGPLVQAQRTATGYGFNKVRIHNNVFKDSLGPAIWAIATTGENEIQIDHNLFENNGLEPASIKTPDVGGITIDGFNAEIKNNTFVKNKGYAIVFSGWKSKSTLKNLKTTIDKNIIVDTEKAYYQDANSGSGIVNLTGSRNAVICSENCQYDNTNKDYYGVTVKSPLSENPLFVSSSDYHLRADSPCRLLGYQLGRYDGTETLAQDNITKLYVTCPQNEAEKVLDVAQNYTIYRRN